MLILVWRDDPLNWHGSGEPENFYLECEQYPRIGETIIVDDHRFEVSHVLYFYEGGDPVLVVSEAGTVC